jgi:uncharacterized protein YlxW (UPF0749 family)
VTSPGPSTGAPVESRTPRQDPTLSLLLGLVDDASDNPYAAAAAAGPRRRVVVTLVLALLGLLLTAAVLQVRASAPAAAANRKALLKEVETKNNDVRGLEQQVAKLQQEVDKLRAATLIATGSGTTLAQQLTTLGVATGTVAVTGPGVEVVVDDAPSDGDTSTKAALGRILDRDLQLLVNGLWAAAAEAVSVNGQRLTSLSSIRAAGDAILVDYRPLTRPYVVRAIGDPKSLEPKFVDGAAGVSLRTLQSTYGIRYDVRSRSSMQLPAASVGSLTYAKPVSSQEVRR